jgi:hypothetical protein
MLCLRNQRLHYGAEMRHLVRWLHLCRLLSGQPLFDRTPKWALYETSGVCGPQIRVWKIGVHLPDWETHRKEVQTEQPRQDALTDITNRKRKVRPVLLQLSLSLSCLGALSPSLLSGEGCLCHSSRTTWPDADRHTIVDGHTNKWKRKVCLLSWRCLSSALSLLSLEISSLLICSQDLDGDGSNSLSARCVILSQRFLSCYPSLFYFLTALTVTVPLT